MNQALDKVVRGRAIKFPQTIYSSKKFVKMLSIRVLLRGFIRVGVVICGFNDADNILSKKSLLWLWVL